MKNLAIVLLIGLTTILVACGGSTEPAPAVAPRTAISLTATDIAYDANRIEVTAGRPVKLTLHNKGSLEHDFSIIEIPHAGEVIAEEVHDEMAGHAEDMAHLDVEPEVHVAAPMGGSHSVEFTPSAPGEYEYYCTVEGHKEAGMVGTLVVTAP